MIFRFFYIIIFMSILFFTSGFNQNPYPRSENLENLDTEYKAKLPLKTNLDLKISSLSSRINEDILFEGTIQPSKTISRKPTGTVTFTQDGKQICAPIVINSVNFRALCRAKNKKIGAHTIMATYSGDDDIYEPSKASMVYYVIKISSKIGLDIKPINDNYNQNDRLMLTANINGTDGKKPMDGTVSFFINTMPIEGCSKKKISEPTCAYTVQKTDSTLEFGAQYSGNENYEVASVQKMLKPKNGLQIELLANNSLGNTSGFSNFNTENKNIEYNFIYNKQTSKDGIDFELQITGNVSDKNIIDLKDDLKISIVSIKPTENYILEKEEVNTDVREFKKVKCVTSTQKKIQNSLVVKCSGFRPVSRKFDLTVSVKIPSQNTLASQTFPIVVKSSRITQTKISNTKAPQFGCGLNGTTRQRMFDCSIFVSNFGGHIESQQNFKPYLIGEVSIQATWFLVQCPQGGRVPQACSWLSPVLEEGNPALSKGEFDTDGVPMSRYKETRLLWSGVSNQPNNFFQANGNDSKIFQYTDYTLINENTMAKSSGTTRHLSQSICETGKGLNLLSMLAPYHWQMPSYPMMMTLTGGKYCDVGGVGYIKDWKAFCNGGSTPWGYRAILIPGFIKNYLWSSSVDYTNNIAWIFNGTDGGVDVDTLDDSANVRCVSATW